MVDGVEGERGRRLQRDGPLDAVDIGGRLHQVVEHRHVPRQPGSVAVGRTALGNPYGTNTDCSVSRVPGRCGTSGGAGSTRVACAGRCGRTTTASSTSRSTHTTSSTTGSSGGRSRRSSNASPKPGTAASWKSAPSANSTGGEFPTGVRSSAHSRGLTGTLRRRRPLPRTARRAGASNSGPERVGTAVSTTTDPARGHVRGSTISWYQATKLSIFQSVRPWSAPRRWSSQTARTLSTSRYGVAATFGSAIQRAMAS